MKKIIYYIILPLLFLLYLLLILNFDFYSFFNKKQISLLVDKINISQLIDNKLYDTKYDYLTKNVIKDSILSLIYEDNHIFTEKEILDEIDKNMEKDINKESSEYKLLRNEIYNEITEVLKTIPNRNTSTKNELNTINNIVHVFSKEARLLIILIIIIVTLGMIPIGLESLKYSAIIMFISSISSIIIKIIICYTCNYFKTDLLFGNMLLEIPRYIYANAYIVNIILIVISIIKLFIYFIFHKNKI